MARLDWDTLATVRLRCAHGRAELAGLRNIPLGQAVRVVMEDFPHERRVVTLIDVEGQILRSPEIGAMYDSPDFPRQRF